MILLKNIPIDSIEDLRNAVQIAIELEHSTIPPYLTANFTLQNTGNDVISDLIGSIVGEEMLHLSIASNLLNAIGGNPVLNKPGFIPTYPGPLPGGVEIGLKVPLAKFTLDLVKDVFMVIEEPEVRIQIKAMMFEAESLTIGQFYAKISNQILVLEQAAKANGQTIFTGDVKNQMTFERFFAKNLLFPITDEASAIRGINIIVDQGEGTSTDPFINPGEGGGGSLEPAHYYRFEEICKGKTLVKDTHTQSGYSYSGADIPFSDALIPNMWENPKMNDYPLNSLAYVNSKMFNYSYTSLLNSLHLTFNGQPDQINAAMGLMFALRLYALKLLAIPDPNHPGYVAGPSFEFVSNENLSTAEKEELMIIGVPSFM